EWSPGGRQIAFLAPDEPSAAKQQKQKDKDDAEVVDTDAQHSRVWILDVASKQARALTGEAWQIRQFAWLPKGDRLLAAATDRPASDDNTTRLFSLSLTHGELTPLVAPEGPMGEFRIAPDGQRVAYIGAAGGPQPHDIFVHATTVEAADPSRDLSAGSLDRAMRGLEWRQDGSLLASAEQGFESALYAIAPDGHATRLEEARPNPRGAVIASTGTVAYVGASATEPPEIYLVRPGAAAARATHLNPSWDTVTLAHPEAFHFASFDGLQIEGRLLKPLDGGAGPYPLVVMVHGGPTGAWSDSIESWGQLLAAHGIAAAYLNIRGSTGYGEKFVEMNRADWGGADFKDVMAGVDYLVAQRIADPARLGIGGWSYGGYMAEWAITQTDRFKAAVSGAGMVDLIAEFDTENGPAYDKWFWGLPYEHAEGFLKHSPFMYLSHAHTPILILQGIADTTDPLGQSTGLYRGLKFYGDKAELVEYPRENHGFREEKHQLDRLNRIVAWYAQYLK
ncbi:MAG: S9 family peptidase, partial [Terriglobales bacterium]